MWWWLYLPPHITEVLLYSLTKRSFKGFLLSFLKAALWRPPRLVPTRPPHWFPKIPNGFMVPADFDIYQRFTYTNYYIYIYIYKLFVIRTFLEFDFFSFLFEL